MWHRKMWKRQVIFHSFFTDKQTFFKEKSVCQL